MTEALGTLRDEIYQALTGVYDPELRRPITDLKMVDEIQVNEAGQVYIRILLTIPGCPLRDVLEREIYEAVHALEGVNELQVDITTMDDEQRAALTAQLRPGGAPTNRFAQPDCPTRVLAVASGKGGVGKSSVTVNLAVALAELGHEVGLLDADIYGHSIPDMMGIGDQTPTVMDDDLILPVPAHGVQVMSIGMLKESRDQVIAWRGPMLDRALSQLLSDVHWADLDYLLIDLPPGTGDLAMSVAHQLPSSQVIVVTTPQQAAWEVAERAGTLAAMLKQPVLGVIENMAWLEVTCPHCGKTHREEIFGTGGGAHVSAALSQRLQADVPLLAQLPLTAQLRQFGDAGTPIVVADPSDPVAVALHSLATRLSSIN